MAGDFNKPDKLSNIDTELFQELHARLDELAKMDFTSVTNLVVGAIIFSAANSRFEKWNGTAFIELITKYLINVDKLDGYDAGNASGNIPVNNGTLNTNLIAQFLGANNQDAAFFRNAANLNAGILAAARLAGTYGIDISGNAATADSAGTATTATNATQLNGQAASFYLDIANITTGVLAAARFNDSSHGSRSGGSLHSVASTTVNGFMSASDKSKLNGIEPGAAADQSASEILTLLKTVDGSGSGLDADTLDGQHLSYFAPAHSHPYLATANNLSDINHAPTARANLGLASLATANDVGQGQIRSALQQSYSVVVNSQWNVGFTGGTWTLGWAFSCNADGVGIYAYHSSTYAMGAALYVLGSKYFQARYISASPPYDMGDGSIPLFVFVMVDVTGNVIAADVAQDPPWAYNGPTRIKADFYQNGKGYQYQKQIPAQYRGKRIVDIPHADRAAFIEAQRNAPVQAVEITQAIKNADMDIIPHPFLDNDLAGKTVVMLDPVGQVALDLRELLDSGESVAKLIADGYLTVDNTPLATRKTPAAVKAHTMRWKNTVKSIS